MSFADDTSEFISFGSGVLGWFGIEIELLSLEVFNHSLYKFPKNSSYKIHF